LRHTPT